MTLTHLSLFTGIGGIDLAAEAAGFETIAQVERDTYCRRVLAKHWPGVPRFDDVRDVTADTLRDAGIERPTLVSGGFPCQPFSCAGKRRGAEDDRFLWPEMCRIVSELRPTWVLGENVAGFVGMALDDCASDLERLGYAVRAFVVPAAGVGACHPRERCFIVANAASRRGGRDDRRDAPGQWDQEEADLARPATDADAEHPRGTLLRAARRGRRLPQPVPGDRYWASAPEPCLRRVDDVVPPRLDRLRALGNAVVPAQVFPFVQAIAEIETTAPATGNAGPLHE